MAEITRKETTERLEALKQSDKAKKLADWVADRADRRVTETDPLFQKAA
jgi:hypothetical protein